MLKIEATKKALQNKCLHFHMYSICQRGTRESTESRKIGQFECYQLMAVLIRNAIYDVTKQRSETLPSISNHKLTWQNCRRIGFRIHTHTPLTRIHAYTHTQARARPPMVVNLFPHS
jgi:uncharacterized membrane protein YukC